jgi:putative ABC transport system substrate-binding protein
MKRREFVGLAGGVALAMPGIARAQQTGGLRQVGVLFPGVLGTERERLINEGLSSELGTEKINLLVRSAEGNNALLEKYARELVASQVDVILAIASGSLQAARSASHTIPIIALDLESDPIATGAVQSLNRPGNNVTGVFFDAPEIASKWIQIIRELLPQINRVGLLFDQHLDLTQLKAGESSAHNVGVTTLRLGIDRPDEFNATFQKALDAKVDAVLVHSSPIFVDEAAVIAGLAREFRIPSIGLFPIYAKVGGLISYGPDNYRLLRQAGGIVGKVLRGAKPSEFPIQRPVYLPFLINLSTAKLLNLTFPASLLALADEVIE